MFQKISIAAGIGVSLALAGQALAWPGLQGRDWDAKFVRVSTSFMKKVTATNITTNGGQHNTSRIDIFVDGARVATSGVIDAAEASAETMLTPRERPYQVEAVCYNERATASRCALTVTKVEIDEDD